MPIESASILVIPPTALIQHPRWMHRGTAQILKSVFDQDALAADDDMKTGWLTVLAVANSSCRLVAQTTRQFSQWLLWLHLPQMDRGPFASIPCVIQILQIDTDPLLRTRLPYRAILNLPVLY